MPGAAALTTKSPPTTIQDTVPPHPSPHIDQYPLLESFTNFRHYLSDEAAVESEVTKSADTSAGQAPPTITNPPSQRITPIEIIDDGSDDIEPQVADKGKQKVKQETSLPPAQSSQSISPASSSSAPIKSEAESNAINFLQDLHLNSDEHVKGLLAIGFKSRTQLADIYKASDADDWKLVTESLKEHGWTLLDLLALKNALKSMS